MLSDNSYSIAYRIIREVSACSFTMKKKGNSPQVIFFSFLSKDSSWAPEKWGFEKQNKNELIVECKQVRR